MRVLFGFANDFPGFTMPKKRVPIPTPPKTRRPKGSGSSSPDARRGGWKGKVPVGKTTEGTTLYRYFHANSQRAVEDLMRGATRPDPNTVTVGEWCDRWLAACKVRASSKKVYAARVEERIRPSLGAVKLAALTAWDIEVAAGAWVGNANTVRDTIGTLGTILKAARKARLVTENVVELVTRPEASATKFDLFTRAELGLILNATLIEHRLHTFAVLVLTGARIGEAIALQPTDFDAAKGELSISRTWTAGGEGPPKSKNSTRTLKDVPQELHAILTAGPPRCHYATAVSRWEALLKSLRLRYRSPHQIRHSVASYGLADAIPVVDLAEHLGHTPEELLRTYGHPTGANVSGAILRLVRGPQGGAV